MTHHVKIYYATKTATYFDNVLGILFYFQVLKHFQKSEIENKSGEYDSGSGGGGVDVDKLKIFSRIKNRYPTFWDTQTSV
jgi:hypothetical protein